MYFTPFTYISINHHLKKKSKCVHVLTSGIIKVYRSQLELVWSFLFTLEIEAPVTPKYICAIHQWHHQAALWLKSSGVDQLLYHQRGSCLSNLSCDQNVSKRHMMAVQLLATMYVTVLIPYSWSQVGNHFCFQGSAAWRSTIQVWPSALTFVHWDCC